MPRTFGDFVEHRCSRRAFVQRVSALCGAAALALVSQARSARVRDRGEGERHANRWQSETCRQNFADPVDGALAAIEQRDWERLELLLRQNAIGQVAVRLV